MSGTDDSDVSARRRAYDDAIEAAMRHAVRHVAWDEAFEIAHEVACEMVRQPRDRVTGGLIYRAVTNRLRSRWRSLQRRTSVERAFDEERRDDAAQRDDALSALETRELRNVIRAALAEMPAGMREAFRLVRDEELSYKEAAARLGVGVGTIHTQLSRANVMLRHAVERYRHGDVRTSNVAGRVQ